MAKKHQTKSTADFLAEREQSTADEYDRLERQSTRGPELQGWFTPSDKRPLPQIIKGEVLDCLARRNPGKNQAERYLLLRLAAPVIGLVMTGEDDEAEEGTLEPGWVIGLDMRQALEPLATHRGKAKIAFLERVELSDGRTWWKTDVFFTPQAAPQAQRGDDILF